MPPLGNLIKISLNDFGHNSQYRHPAAKLRLHSLTLTFVYRETETCKITHLL